MTVLETTLYRAPLGLQFVDSVGAALVADGLVVTAWPAGDPGAARPAQRSPISTTLGFGDFPGAWSFEEAGSPPGSGRPFEVRMLDPLGRYLPELIAVSVPQAALMVQPLFSAPTRPVPSGFATIGGEVWSTGGTPAAWAVVEMTAGPYTYTTLADQVGRYVVYLPYPEALPPLTWSPPGGDALGQITWTVSTSVQFQPSVQDRLPDAQSTDPPELSSLLGQAPATVTAGATATLTFGSKLLLMITVVPT